MKRFLLLSLLLFAALCGQAQTSRTVSLDGRWKTAVGNAEPAEYPATVPVPGIVSQAEPPFGIDFDATQLRGEVGYDYVWYACDFDLSSTHDDYDNRNYRHAFLHLRAKYNALVILNGIEIGYDPHTTYSHGEFDVTKALNFGGSNRLVVRVGSWNTASYPSKDNSAEWWRTSRAPGICDHVTLELTHDVAIRHLRLLPSVATGEVVCMARIANMGTAERKMSVRTLIYDCSHDLDNDFYDTPAVCDLNLGQVTVPADTTAEYTFRIPTPMLRPWSPGREGDPQLYEFNLVLRDELSSDCRTVTFGYRDIRTEGRDVLLNGKKILFRAENIAFQRAQNRWAAEVYDEAWIRRFLRAAVRDYGFNYLRIHLGHAFGKWYDIADEEGIMLQDEWRFMHDDEPSGDNLAQTEIEFRRWVAENVNHPSIVAWDQQNEGDVRLEALKAELRRYDPTRLWGEDDFDARHIYDYSETIVDTPEHPIPVDKPLTVLESCRLWLDPEGNVARSENFKTSRTASGWNLWFYTPAELEQLQADIHADLGTFYRSQRVQAWAPFALLSGGVNGQNYFRGNLSDSLSPKPCLEVLRRLNERIGVSVAMNQAQEWYREKRLYAPGSKCEKTLWVWNDTDSVQNATLIVSLENDRGRGVFKFTESVRVAPYAAEAVLVCLKLPARAGCYRLIPALVLHDSHRVEGVERRLMIARQTGAATDGVLAFGGHNRPFAGCHSLLANFLDDQIPSDVQTKIVGTLSGELIDKAERTAGNGFRIQTTRYLGAGQVIQSIRTFSADGELQSCEQSEARTYVSLPDAVRKTIVGVVGAVPVDESKLTLRHRNGVDIYTIQMVGSDLRYTIRMTPEGGLLGAESASKKK